LQDPVRLNSAPSLKPSVLKLCYWAWPVSVAVFFSAAILKSGPLGAILPDLTWNIIQFAPVVLASFATFVGRGPSDILKSQRRVLFAMAAVVVGATTSLITTTEFPSTLAQLAVLLGMFAFLVMTFVYRWTSRKVVDGDLLFVVALLTLNQAIGVVGGVFAPQWAIGDFLRFIGTTSNANYAGMVSALAISLAVHLLLGASARVRVVLAITIAVNLSALVWSGSRGAMFALALGALALLIVQRRWRTLAVSSIAAAVAAIAVGALVPTILNRVSADDLDSGRFGLYATVISHWLDSPFFGIGYRTTSALDETQGFEAHNVYLSVLAETGAVGFVAFLALLVVIFVAGRGGSLIMATITVVAVELFESSLFGWGGPTALFSWVTLLAYAAHSRYPVPRRVSANGETAVVGDHQVSTTLQDGRPSG
jgi:O-antigen ligase